MNQWRADVLGDEFECTDIDLGEDSEGPLLATLVRALPKPLGFLKQWLHHTRDLENVDVLYVHGWSDYFFQKPLARFFTDRGARFFALDLRKYGRSLREGQTAGLIEDLSLYDEEIDAAVELIRGPADEPHGGGQVAPRRLLLLGHSTGGLVLSLWADRHRGVAEALVLNSPWLELQVSGSGRKLLAPLVNATARIAHSDKPLPQFDPGFYSQAQRLSGLGEDWEHANLDWRPERTMPVHVSWLGAILAGHAKISGGIDVGAPVCVLLSKRSHFGVVWDDAMLHADTVLEVEGIAQAALKLGSSVTLERIDGALHDVFLSEASVRGEAYSRLNRWLLGWQAVQAAQG